jgi:hypothetical protein
VEKAGEKAVDKPVTRKVASAGGSGKMPPALVPGDAIEYALTAAIKHRTKGEWWLKVGVTSVIRDGESVTTAKRRIKTFVHDMLDESAKEVLS